MYKYIYTYIYRERKCAMCISIKKNIYIFEHI